MDLAGLIDSLTAASDATVRVSDPSAGTRAAYRRAIAAISGELLPTGKRLTYSGRDHVTVMDLAPISIYTAVTERRGCLSSVARRHDALLRAVTMRGVACRLLVSEWAHTSPYVAPFSRGFERGRRQSHPRVPAGSLEIRRFRVPAGTGR